MNRRVMNMAIRVVVALIFICGCARAHAQFGSGVVDCVNCSSFAEQLTQEVDENSTMIQVTQSAATQLQMLSNQLMMMKVTPGQAFSQVGNILQVLQETSQGGNALSYAMSNLDGQFNANYAQLGYAPTTPYSTRYSQWSATSRDTTQKALDVASQQNTNQQSEASLITNLQNQAQSADAAVSTVQVGNQIASEQLNQLMQLRQLMMADISSKAAFQAQQVKEHDQAAASGGLVQSSGPAISDVNTFSSTINSSGTN